MPKHYQLQVRTMTDAGRERCLRVRDWVEDSTPLIFPYPSYEEAEKHYDEAMQAYLELATKEKWYPIPEGHELKWRMTGAEFNPEDEGGFWFVIFWQPSPKKFVELAEGRILIRRAETPDA